MTKRWRYWICVCASCLDGHEGLWMIRYKRGSSQREVYWSIDRKWIPENEGPLFEKADLVPLVGA